MKVLVTLAVGLSVALLLSLLLYWVGHVSQVLSWILGAIGGIALAYLTWNTNGGMGYVFKGAFGFWALGFILGLVYIGVFAADQAQAVFLPVFITGPAAGILGIFWGVYKTIREKKMNSVS